VLRDRPGPDGRAVARPDTQEVRAVATILVIVLILVLVGALPSWPYSSGWGYYPSGALSVVLLVILILFLTGRL
jgi:membrane protein YdbS with pleckstrin-like domain